MTFFSFLLLFVICFFGLNWFFFWIVVVVLFCLAGNGCGKVQLGFKVSVCVCIF